MLGVFLPAALTVVGKMQDAAGHIDIEEARNHLSDVVRVSGRGKFVCDSIDVLLFTSPLDHRVDKAGPVRTEYPRHAQHQMPILRLQYQFLANALGFSIDADWLGSIGFDVRLALFTIENVIGAEMNQLCFLLGTNFGEMLRRFRVDRKSLLALRFAKIDIRHRGAVDHQIELKW